jgi:16S rRNA (adenine1518-N6/adenine1519-N6)-dimethyltransferase
MPLDPASLATPAGTVRLLRQFGIHPRKRLGQHFLVSPAALQSILQAAELDRTDTVLEIGAGVGTLTAALAQRAGRVVAVEVDPAVLPALRAVVAPYPHVRVVQADAMAADLAALLPAEGERKVVANLPYRIASPLAVKLLDPSLRIRRLVLTVQREVAERMAARPGDRDYGLLSVLVQSRAAVTVVRRLPPGAFYPPPEVESAVVRLDPHHRPPWQQEDERFVQVVRAAFAQRRKTLRNALAAALDLTPAEAAAACARAGIAPGRRGETLTLQEFAALARAVGESAGAAGRRGR